MKFFKNNFLVFSNSQKDMHFQQTLFRQRTGIQTHMAKKIYIHHFLYK